MSAVCSSNVAALLLLLLAIGALTVDAGSTGSSNSTQAYSCDAVHKVPTEQRCSFIRSSCASDGLVPYAEWYYCHVAQSAAVLRWMYVAAVCCLLPLAFCLLGDTAEFYIAPIMAHVSQAVPKMRPRFAGVTFVALGNGAPDLSANIAAISAGEVTLSAGALTGAAMFVQCIVAAELVALAGPRGIKCGGAMLRDVGVYCLAIFSVLLAFFLGQVSRVFVGWAVALYAVYMIWVFAGDEWHQRGRPTPRLDAVQSFKTMLSGYLQRGSSNIVDAYAAQQGPWRLSAAGSGSTPVWGANAGSRPGSLTSGAQRISSGLGYGTRDELEESLLPWAVAEEEPNTFYAVGNGMQGAGGDLQQGFAQLPQSVAERLAAGLQLQAGRSSSGSGGATGGGRPSSALSAQLSTELSDFGAATLSSRRGSAIGDGGGMLVGSPTHAGMFGATEGSLSFTQQQQQQLWAMRGGSSSYSHTNPASARTSAPLLQMQLSHPPSRSVTPPNPLLHPVQPHLVSMGSHSYLDPKTYKQLVWADLADDAEEEARLERDIARQLLSRRGPGSFAGTGTYQPPSAAQQQQFSSMPVTPIARHSSQQQQQQQQSATRTSLTGLAGRDTPEQQAAAAAAAGGIPPAEMESGLLFSPFGPEVARTAPSTPTAAADEAAAAAAGLDLPLRQHSAAAATAEWRGRQASEAGMGFGSSAGMQQQQQQLGQAGAAAVDNWQQLQWELTLGNSEEWQEAGAVRKMFRKVTFPLLLPAYLGQRLTIPFASSAGYSRQWLIAALLCCPLALILYLGLLTMPAVLAACGCGIAAAAAAALLTAWDAAGQMPVQGLGGTAAAVAPGVLAVLAFCMGVVWIDTVATEVVGVITFLGGLAGLPAGVMGLTLLAWGNSLGDYFGNRAMAKAGHGSTAITACFAAPLFNMLMSLSLGFSSYLHKLGAVAVHVELTPEVALGCVFLMGYNIVIIAVGRLCDNRLPPWFAYFARAWYALYFGLSLFFGFYGAGTATTASAAQG